MNDAGKPDDRAPVRPDWRADIIEQRRQAREQELWGIPAISIAAQAFLFTTGLEADTSPAARTLLGLIGLLTAIATTLVVLRQAARVNIMRRWMEEVNGAYSVWTLRTQLAEQRAVGGHGRTPSPLERLPKWLLGPPGHRQISTAHVWLGLLLAFAVADLLVIASSFDGLRLLQLGR